MAPSPTIHRYTIAVDLSFSDDQITFLQQHHAELQALSPDTPFSFENFLEAQIYTQFTLWLLERMLQAPEQARSVGERHTDVSAHTSQPRSDQ